MGNFQYMIPIFGMAFVSFMLYLEYKGKQLKIKEKVGLMEKGLDPSKIDEKPKYLQDSNQKGSLKTGLMLIGAALGIFVGYLLNLLLDIPDLVAYSTMILVFCGALLVYFHKSKTE